MIPYDTWTRDRLEETISWLEGWLQNQPNMSAANGLEAHRDWSIRLGRALVSVAGAREATIAAVGQAYKVDLFGIKATSTGGLHAACRNWIVRAQAKFGERG